MKPYYYLMGLAVLLAGQSARADNSIDPSVPYGRVLPHDLSIDPSQPYESILKKGKTRGMKGAKPADGDDMPDAPANEASPPAPAK